jgi:ribosomal protein L24
MINFCKQQVLWVKSGKFEGMAGECIAINEKTGMVKIDINGVKDDVPVIAQPWIKAGSLRGENE